MVVFTCNNCGDSLQKPRVEKHYQTACRQNFVNVTCMDCFKDFRGEEYVAHTKCISEAERYSGKEFTPKAGQNKGEKKQIAWVEGVQSILENNKNITAGERNLLNAFRNYQNIPRKKPQYLNFVKNVMRSNGNNMSIVESVWNLMEATQNKLREENQINNNLTYKNRHDDPLNNTSKNSVSENKSVDKPEAAKLSKQQRKEKRINEKYEELLKVESPHKENSQNTNNEHIRKKSKKRNLEETAIVEQPLAKISKSEEISDKFNWVNVITAVLKSKNNEMSIKKLKKKVLAEYKGFMEIEECPEKIIAKFNKKLTKIKEIQVTEEKVFINNSMDNKE